MATDECDNNVNPCSQFPMYVREHQSLPNEILSSQQNEILHCYCGWIRYSTTQQYFSGTCTRYNCPGVLYFSTMVIPVEYISSTSTYTIVIPSNLCFSTSTTYNCTHTSTCLTPVSGPLLTQEKSGRRVGR